MIIVIVVIAVIIIALVELRGKASGVNRPMPHVQPGSPGLRKLPCSVMLGINTLLLARDLAARRGQ